MWIGGKDGSFEEVNDVWKGFEESKDRSDGKEC